jgi:hypothetical protein
MTTFELWKKAQKELQEARSWVQLKGQRGYSNDCFSLSPIHGQVKMMLCGQHYSGGQNYWDSPEKFNEALREVMVEKFAELSAAVLDKLESKARIALIACQDEVAAMQDAIHAAKTTEAA